jgi:L-lactate dehydrogenase complex protein LldG
MTSALQSRAELLQRFALAARIAGATVESIPRSAGPLAVALLRASDGARPILFAGTQDLPSGVFTEFRSSPGVVVDPTTEQLSSSPVGVTEAFAAIARTGSVCVDIGHGLTGMISLLPRLHIAVVSADAMVAQPRDLFDPGHLGGAGLACDFVVVTGPSATADMGSLVRGVHGPHRLHIVVLD